MKKGLLVVLIAILVVGVFVSRQGVESREIEAASEVPVAVTAAVFAESLSPGDAVRAEGKRSAGNTGVLSREIGAREPILSNSNFAHDADASIAAFSGVPMPSPSLSFDGLANKDNVDAYGLLIIPPDMNGDVGPDHYVQIVNSLVRIYDKNGAASTPPMRISDIFASLNTPCSTRNDGLPNVQYDTLADRWLISQICSNFPPFRQLVAISRTGDPTGQYYLYEFVMPNTRQHDFPKFGVWPDAYYMSSDEFLGSDYVGSGAFAFDRKKMLAGDATASYIYFNLPAPPPIRRGGLLPADLDGLRSPGTGSPGIFAGYTATEYGSAQDAIRLFNFHADFANPLNSTFTERPESPIAVTAFDPTSPEGRPDIMQPAPGERLDSVSDRLNHRLAYRNFVTHESLVVNQTARTTPLGQTYRAGVRVYELRRSGGAFTPVVQITIGDTFSSRWVGAAALDHQGNLAVGYNTVSDEKQPSIKFTGRLATDPAGTFRDERTLVDGTGVQRAFGWRWGEYSGLTVDPVDDCTFWITNGYYTLESQEFSDFGWLTRIGRFRFDECTNAPRASVSGTVTNAASSQPIAEARITASDYSRSTAVNGSYGPLAILPGAYSVTASANGFRSQTFSLTAANGDAVIRNFALDPIPVLETDGNTITAESCRINNAPEPGETITLNVTPRNPGGRDAANLIATILPTGGITNPRPPQNFGAVPVNAAVARPITFTVSSGLACGSVAVLTLELRDGAEPIALTQINLQTGEQIFAFRENFDSVTVPALPSGWTTSTTPNHQLWRTSTTRFQSSANSLFSPAPHQQGINEVTSPEFAVASPNAEIVFRNWYELETTFLRNRLYDGSVLEIKIGSGEFQDILAAGGSFLSGGYDGTIDSCCQNPLAGRLGWSGRSGLNQVSEFITTRAKLPTSAAGRRVRLRWRIGTDIGVFREGQYIDDLAVTDGYSCGCVNVPLRSPFDFDADGRTDLSVFDLNDADIPDFRVMRSSDQANQTASWGSAGDVPANADFDGDGRTDFAVFRPANGTWYILRSSNATIGIVPFGLTGDRPVPADFDGDARADIAVFRPSSGVWYVLRSSDSSFFAQAFGLNADIPVTEDYDGDSRADLAVFRPSSGIWYVSRSSDGAFFADRFGLIGDKPVPGDFDGDGRADLNIFRPSDGTWYLLRSSLGFSAIRFGLAQDRPLQADFDGDGRRDISIYRPSERVWYYLQSSDGAFAAIAYGNAGEMAVPGIFIN